MAKEIKLEDNVKLKSESDVLNYLAVSDFADMTKKDYQNFTAIMPFIDDELAQQCLEQFPDFKSASEIVVNQLKDMFDFVLKDNRHANDEAIKSYQFILEDLRSQLKSKRMSFKQQRSIIEQEIRVANKIAELDKENKAFLFKMLKIGGGIAAGAAAVPAAAIAIAKFLAKR